MEVKSPCNKICEIDPANGYCKGCWRTLNEIAAWASITDSERQTILNVLKQRKLAQTTEYKKTSY